MYTFYYVWCVLNTAVNTEYYVYNSLAEIRLKKKEEKWKTAKSEKCCCERICH